MEWLAYIASVPEGYFPFVVALGLMLAIAAIEFTATIMGVGIFSFLDSLVPDIEWDASPLDFLAVGRVPIYVLIILFLTFFGASGLAIQYTFESLVGFSMPTWPAGLLAFLFALLPLKISATVIAKILPDIHTTAVSPYTFIGKQAEVTLGECWRGHPAQAKLQDHYGRTHYIMVEPKLEGIRYKQGDTVKVSEKREDSNTYLVL